jgi:hypothetical protein
VYHHIQLLNNTQITLTLVEWYFKIYTRAHRKKMFQLGTQLTPIILPTREAETERIPVWVQSGPNKQTKNRERERERDLISKYSTHTKKKKKIGRMAQVTEHLPSKREVLSSDPTTRGEREQTGKRRGAKLKDLVGCSWLEDEADHMAGRQAASRSTQLPRLTALEARTSVSQPQGTGPCQQPEWV